MEHIKPVNARLAGQAHALFDKALPVPPPSNEIGRRGKTNPFPSANKALPATHRANMDSNTSIPRRPVGSQASAGESSTRSVSPESILSPGIIDSYLYASSPTGDSIKAIETEMSPALPPKGSERRQLPRSPMMSPALPPKDNDMRQLLRTPMPSPAPPLKDNEKRQLSRNPMLYPALPPKDDERRQLPRSPVLSPALPPKDTEKRPLPPSPMTQNHVSSNSVSSNGSSASSSPKSELWRRRSVKSDGSVAISDLKLAKTNGFTTSPALMKATSPLPALPSREDAAEPPKPQPPRKIVGLPGRSIKKPVPDRLAPGQTPDDMGSPLSKVLKLDKNDQSREGPGAPFTPIKRLPTPEYQAADKQLQQQQPPTPQIFPPALPETPPRDLSPELPQDGSFLGKDSIPENATSNRFKSPGPPPSKPAPLEIPSLLRAGHRPPSPGPSPQIRVTAGPGLPHSPQPRKLSGSKLLKIEATEPSKDGGTASADSKSSPSSSPVLLPLPALPTSAKTLPCAPLSVTHFACYQSHRFLRPSRNDLCPLECMVCESKDVEKRWICTWCCLRCCDACTKAMSGIPGRDLGVLLRQIGKGERVVVGSRDGSGDEGGVGIGPWVGSGE